MPIDAAALKLKIDQELAGVSDRRVIDLVRSLLVEPVIVFRDWDYGVPGEQFPCWIVLNDPVSRTAIAFCEQGLGPKYPWGLVWSEEGADGSMGMDSDWFPTLLDVFFDSAPASRLPIWYVARTETDGQITTLSGELTREEAWSQIKQLRQLYPSSRFDCLPNRF